MQMRQQFFDGLDRRCCITRLLALSSETPDFLDRLLDQISLSRHQGFCLPDQLKHGPQVLFGPVFGGIEQIGGRSGRRSLLSFFACLLLCAEGCRGGAGGHLLALDHEALRAHVDMMTPIRSPEAQQTTSTSMCSDRRKTSVENTHAIRSDDSKCGASLKAGSEGRRTYGFALQTRALRRTLPRGKASGSQSRRASRPSGR